ncbi:hypothetical protein SARC_06027 [Sphaeroforma arctica JP610]|uniref:Uncharacterized protein n=1 Tax=Sphaeroforma arctica JP610 TaxID=667725 RepID=A0A0L0FXU9_9EUKA|nr:hypothetical protein SARC_06027 [Sphaeroforma arctica JP610]KNC81655.1 hypothetical protein SARC_06027 [Sphaeroforma arctica JP610]|eukprot:XP_014155557.1 hypothetical protein SARC_06027 [Sphaeroforma arctica JP610]
MYANTHTEISATGVWTGSRREQARDKILQACCGIPSDHVGLFSGSGATGAIDTFKRFLMRDEDNSMCSENVAVISGAKVLRCKQSSSGNVDLDHAKNLLKKYHNRQLILGTSSAALNVDGTLTDSQALELFHRFGAYITFDYAAAAPYVDLNMAHMKEINFIIEALEWVSINAWKLLALYKPNGKTAQHVVDEADQQWLRKAMGLKKCVKRVPDLFKWDWDDSSFKSEPLPSVDAEEAAAALSSGATRLDVSANAGVWLFMPPSARRDITMSNRMLLKVSRSVATPRKCRERIQVVDVQMAKLVEPSILTMAKLAIQSTAKGTSETKFHIRIAAKLGQLTGGKDDRSISIQEFEV